MKLGRIYLKLHAFITFEEDFLRKHDVWGKKNIINKITNFGRVMLIDDVITNFTHT